MKEIKESCYKGTRILLGNKKRDVINSFVQILKERGFEEISIPIIQLEEIFKDKVGEENNNLMFTFKDRGNRELALSPEYCQVKGTYVSTASGILKLEEIGNTLGGNTQDIDIKVYNDKQGDLNTSTKFFRQGKKKTVKLALDSGIELECTLNHKYRVLESGKYRWKSSKNLKVGDKLPYSINEYVGGKYQELTHNFKKKKGNTSKQVIKLPKVLERDLAWFLGLYFADGCNLSRGFHIYGDKLKKRGFEKLKSILRKYNVSNKYYENKTDNRCYISINCVELISFLKENNLLKRKSFNIEFPLLIRKSPRPIIKAFINGYLCGDGHIYPQGVGCVSTSKEFIKQLTIINRAIGVDGKFIKRGVENSWGKRTKYRYWSRMGRNAPLNGRQRGLKELDTLGYNNLLYDKIKSIKYSENKVYEISVPESGTYVANSYISHNTAVVQKLAETTFKRNKDVKLFYIQECFRGEKPQAGRYRQFTQLGIEILNPRDENASLQECIAIARELLDKIGITYQVNEDVVRGLDYYKLGRGFQIDCIELGAQKQILGGGTYQGGVGFALGVDRILSLVK